MTLNSRFKTKAVSAAMKALLFAGVGIYSCLAQVL